jgi:TolB-like protein/DNA-binding winged helix-turn-helix (wHTH) protein/Tfp pilus assembly protein PilF
MDASLSGGYAFGPFRVDLARHVLLRGSDVVPLTTKAFDTLVILVRNSGRMLEKDELMRLVWPDTAVEEGNLTVAISMLRKALGEEPGDSQYIQTVPRRGYRFVAAVRECGDVHEKRFPSRRVIVAAGAALSLALTGLLVYGRVFVAAPPSGGGIDSLAVLPFENLSGDAAQEYFVDGLTDALITHLGRIDALRVISWTSAMQYKGHRKSVSMIGRELNVRAIVEGSFVRSGNRLEIRVRLVDASADRQLWTGTYQRTLTDVVALQVDVAQSIAERIRAEVGPAHQKRRAPAVPINREAYEAFLLGGYFCNRNTSGSREKGIGHFQAAIRADGNYAPAHEGLARCYALLGELRSDLPPDEWRARAEASARTALALDPRLGEAHALLAYLRHWTWQWAEAQREISLALELSPNYHRAHIWHANQLITAGRLDEALAAARRARDLDPLSLQARFLVARVLFYLRRYDAAMQHVREILDLAPDHANALTLLGQIYLETSTFEKAIPPLEQVATLQHRSAMSLGVLGHAYARAGRRADARRMLDELQQRSARRYVTPASIVYIYLGLGETEQTFAWLERAYAQRSAFLAFLTAYPFVDPIRSDPRYEDLVRRIGLRPGALPE